MKYQSPVKLCLLAVCLITSCSLFSGDFRIETASPQKTYFVKLEGREQSLTSTVQQVKLTVLKGTEAILVEDKFYREEADHAFLREFPVHEWLSDSVLRLGKENGGPTSGDKIVVVNNGNDRVDVLKVEYASQGEKFLIFDLAPDSKLELTVVPYSRNGKSPNPSVSYTVYSNGRASKNTTTEWRKTGAGSEILIAFGNSSAEENSKAQDLRDACSPTILATNSPIITGHIVLTDGTKNLSGVEIQVFSLKDGVWTFTGRIHTLSKGDFAWLAEDKGQYKFFASKDGFKANIVIVNVKNLKEAHPEIILPLSKSGCSKAKYT